MTSIDEFYFRYYANRLLREGHIDEREYRHLLAANGMDASQGARTGGGASALR